MVGICIFGRVLTEFTYFRVLTRQRRSIASTAVLGMSGRVTAPYGSWKSPITADIVSGAEKKVGGIAVAGDGSLLWVESRPSEVGRAVLVKQEAKLGDVPIDITPKEFSVRTLVQEYGGGAFAVADDLIIFSNQKDQRLYKQIIGEFSPLAVTPDYGEPNVRYADGVFDSHFEHYITVREDHRSSSLNPVNDIVAIDLKAGNSKEPKVLVTGKDFYAFPRVDPTGKRMAWIEWSHPNMPWDRTQLWVGYFSEDGDICRKILVAGQDLESPTEPKWSPTGELFFVTDRGAGFWNLYKWIEEKNECTGVYPMEAEFTRPLWVFGFSSYDFIPMDAGGYCIACTYRQRGYSYLGILDGAMKSLSLLDVPFSDISNIISSGSCIFIEGASAAQPLSLAKVTLNENLSGVVDFLVMWSSLPYCAEFQPYFSSPELIEFPTACATETAFAYFYPPTNHVYQACPEEKPPLLLNCHGGPTAEARGVLNLGIQFWTSRGWAFADVNYGGSTGYGRKYRERLVGQWGTVDVDDCCRCAAYLVELEKVDAERLCITGRSAGGYTTLAALAFRKTFKAGASLYGVADLSLLRSETHKFESHYIDNLVGGEKMCLERSPINSINNFCSPVILFQGLDDKVVPPDQARKIHQALKRKRIPVALVEYEGEQHGFRKAENIKYTLEQMMVFFARLVGKFTVADKIIPIKIDNFD